jgi:hypothetical protein
MRTGILIHLLIKSSQANMQIYVWGPVGSQIPNTLEIGNSKNLSFIQLLYDDGVLTIDLVQRGTSWTHPEKFCSSMLPVAIDRFLSESSVNLQSDVDQMVVINQALPSIAGCLCYVRTMMSFGFTVLNGGHVKSKYEFCERHGDVVVVDASPALRETVPEIPSRHIYEFNTALAVSFP